MHRLGQRGVCDPFPPPTWVEASSNNAWRDALPKVKPLSPREIAAVREVAGVSQAVLAGFLNVGVTTVSQWERGLRRPTGTALKLLHVVKNRGLEALR
jgi:putative transcriptional regulator